MRTVYEKADVLPMLGEVFRELGYEGASFGKITEHTGISKGSLYHFFPDGKEQMAAEVIAQIDGWFVANVYRSLEQEPPTTALERMWEEVETYFRSGRRVCLIGAFALDTTRDSFAAAIRAYFDRWVRALARCLKKTGIGPAAAQACAEDVVAGIQGALVLSRALDDQKVFLRAVQRLRNDVDVLIAQDGSPSRKSAAPRKRKVSPGTSPPTKASLPKGVRSQGR